MLDGGTDKDANGLASLTGVAPESLLIAKRLASLNHVIGDF